MQIHQKARNCCCCSATSVAPIFNKGEEKEKEQNLRQPHILFARYMKRREENVSDNPSLPAPPKEPEQSKPRVLMRVCRIIDPNSEPKDKEDDYYCVICTPEGHECSGNRPDASDWAEDKDTSDWSKTKHHLLKGLTGMQTWRRHLLIM